MNSISIVIPVFNEEEILERQINYIIPELKKDFQEIEIVLSENGSVDKTKEIIRDLSLKINEVTPVIDNGIADYGQALINGINACKYEIVSIIELDYLDLDFCRRSYKFLSEYDLIIGSKKISSGIDRRPWKRRLFTNLYNFLLKKMFHLKLTETHGLKTFKKSKLHEITNGCITRHAVYPSEFVIRAWRDNRLRVYEIPLSLPLVEIRKTRISAAKRLRRTFNDLILLYKVTSVPL